MKLWTAGEDPLVTAVVCCYNKLDLVQKAVESVIKYKGIADEDIHCVLWDQESPYPGVKEYLEKVNGETGDWLEVRGFGFNVGIGTALNNVIEDTKSKFIFKFDDDNALLPFTLPLLLIAHSLAGSCGFPLAVLSADVLGVGKAQGELTEYELWPGLILQCTWCVGGGAVLIPRRVIEDVGPFRADRLYGVEDGDFAYRAVQKGYVNAYLKDAYHVSFCRGEHADPQIDAWKLEYYAGKTDLPFDKWRTARTFDGGFIDKGE